MTVTTTLALEWELIGHDSQPGEEIREDIDCDHDEELPPDSLVDSTSIRN